MLAPAILGVAAIATLPWALSSGPRTADTELTASVTECHDMVTVSVAGRNDTPRAGTTKMLVGADGKDLPAALSSDYRSDWVDPVVNAPAGSVGNGSYAAVYIAYPANMDSYDDAVNVGVANTESVMRQIQTACPNTKFAITGYSEGADVARRVAMNVGHQQVDADGGYTIVDPSSVVGVVILADAGRAAGQGPFPGAKNPFTNPDGFNTKYQNGKTPTPGQGAVTNTGGDDFGALAGKIAAFCSDGDLTCAAPQNISLLQLVINLGRQLNVDGLEKNGLTPATGQDVAVTLGRIATDAFAMIQSQPNWMQGDQTFLDVLLTVSDPSHKPGTKVQAPAKAESISADTMSPLAYLPKKVFKEIVGLIVTNQNTIPVVMSDPYNLTLAPNGKGHHFDYWRDSNAAAGKPLTSAEYAAAWLTELAKQAQAGQPIDPTTKPDSVLSSAGTGKPSATPTPSVPPSTPATTTSETTTPAPTTEPVTSTESTTETTAPAPGADASAVTPTSAPATTSPATPVDTLEGSATTESPAAAPTTSPATTTTTTSAPATPVRGTTE